VNHYIGKVFIIAGGAAIIIGIIFIYGEKIPIIKYLGKLPGDIRIQKENFYFNFPVTTCILLSVIVTIIFRIIAKIK